jgi:hypothetical protein
MSIQHRHFIGRSCCFLVILVCWPVVAAFGSEKECSYPIVVGLAEVKDAPASREVLASLNSTLVWNGDGQGRSQLGKRQQLITARSVIQSSGTTYDFQLLNGDEVCIRRGKIKAPEYGVPFCVVLCVKEGGAYPSLSSNSLWAVGIKVPVERDPEIVYDATNHRYHVGTVEHVDPSELMHIMPIAWIVAVENEEALRKELFRDSRQFRLVWNGYIWAEGVKAGGANLANELGDDSPSPLEIQPPPETENVSADGSD